MWENIGKKVQAFVLIFIIALLSLVMGVVGFGNPSGEGCGAEGPGFAAQVYGASISEGEFRAAFTATGFSTFPAERAEALRLRFYTLEGLIERELLVREAERLGIQADPDEVLLEVARGEFVRVGGPVDPPDQYPAGEVPQHPQNYRDRDGNFSRERFERFVQNNLRRSIEEFMAWQVAETRANRVREMVTASVGVSPREVWDAYVQENERAQLSYVRFDPAHYRQTVEATDEAVGAWMAEHTEEVDTEYVRQRHRYTDLPEQTRARHILIAVAESAEDAEREEKRALAEGLLQQLRDGGDFEALAREHSTDEGSAARGGDVGWFPRGQMVAPFETAAFDAEPNTLVDEIIESRFGFHIIEVLGHRSGDIPEADAKRELAEGLFRQARAIEMARAEAERALTYLSDGHTPEELDERLLHSWREDAPAPEDTGDIDIGDIDDIDAEEPEPEPERGPRAPQVRETLNFGRAERAIPGPFDSGPLTQAAFEMTMENPLPDEPIQLGDSWFIYQLISRTTAEEEGFDDANRERLRSRLVARKQRETLSAYVGRLRAQAESENAIVINNSVLSYGTETEDESGDEDEGDDESDDEEES